MIDKFSLTIEGTRYTAEFEYQPEEYNPPVPEELTVVGLLVGGDDIDIFPMLSKLDQEEVISTLVLSRIKEDANERFLDHLIHMHGS